MRESSINEAHVSGFSDLVVRGMVEFIYRDKTAIIMDFAVEWLNVAEMYKLDKLKADAAAVIGANLTIENSAIIFDAAILYNLPSLKAKVNQFIKE